MRSIFREKYSLIVIAITILTLGLSNVQAQIGDLGIYGSPPATYRDNVRFVRLERYPATGDDVHVQTLPVNGLRNFNFYYAPDGRSFLPGGGYRVFYLGSDEVTVYGHDVVSYAPNSGHTNGTKVRDFNSPPSTPRGLHGRLLGRINGILYPFPNAGITAVGLYQSDPVTVFTNGDGYFNVYYQNGDARKFLAVDPTFGHEHYSLIVQGYFHGCSFSEYFPLQALWEPYNAVYPALPSYFVDWAETDVGDLILDASNCED